MEKKDITAKTLTVSEETREIYILSRELQQIQDKLGKWYEAMYGLKDDEEANYRIMDEYNDKAYKAFISASEFIESMMGQCIIENLHSEDWVL